MLMLLIYEQVHTGNLTIRVKKNSIISVLEAPANAVHASGNVHPHRRWRQCPGEWLLLNGINSRSPTDICLVSIYRLQIGNNERMPASLLFRFLF